MFKCQEDFNSKNGGCQFDYAAEILLHMTKSTPVDDPGPAAVRRNQILAEVMAERPHSQVSAMIYNELGLMPRKGFFAALFTKGGKF